MIERTRCVLGTLPKIHSERFESFEREINFEDRIFRFFSPIESKEGKKERRESLEAFLCDTFLL